MKRIHTALFSALAALLLSSCSYGLSEAFYRSNGVGKRASILQVLKDDETPALEQGTSYTVAVFTDIHFGKGTTEAHRLMEENFKAWLKEQVAAGNAPAFCISLGDDAEHGYEGEFKDYMDFCREVEQIAGCTVYHVLGNHDLFNSGWNYYSELVFPYSFFSFETPAFSWYFIDSASDSLGPDQMEQLEKAMAKDSKPKVFSMHVPIYGDINENMGYFTLQNSLETDRLLTLCAKSNVKLVLEGHTHKYNRNNFASFEEYTVPSILARQKWTVLHVDESNGTITASDPISYGTE